MYNKITIDELLELNNKDINPQSAPKTEENKTNNIKLLITNNKII